MEYSPDRVDLVGDSMMELEADLLLNVRTVPMESCRLSVQVSYLGMACREDGSVYMVRTLIQAEQSHFQSREGDLRKVWEVQTRR